VNYNSLIRVKIKVRDFSRAMPRFAQPDPGRFADGRCSPRAFMRSVMPQDESRTASSTMRTKNW